MVPNGTLEIRKQLPIGSFESPAPSLVYGWLQWHKKQAKRSSMKSKAGVSLSIR